MHIKLHWERYAKVELSDPATQVLHHLPRKHSRLEATLMRLLKVHKLGMTAFPITR